MGILLSINKYIFNKSTIEGKKRLSFGYSLVPFQFCNTGVSRIIEKTGKEYFYNENEQWTHCYTLKSYHLAKEI